MIRFIKTLRYQSSGLEPDSFSYVSKLLKQDIDPPSTAMASVLLTAPTVFYSPLRRVRDTVLVDTDKKYQILTALREIPFDLKQFCTADEWSVRGSNAVRDYFIKAFVDDHLLQTRHEIFREMQDTLKKISAACQYGDVIVVSHSFRLKIFEALIRTRGALEREPALIHKYIAPQERTYAFGGGFTVAVQEIVDAMH